MRTALDGGLHQHANVPSMPDQPMTPEARYAALIAARQGYLENVSRFYDEPVLEVIDRVSTSGSLGKADLDAVLLWKRIESGGWKETLLCMADAEVRSVTASAVAAARDRTLSVPEAARAARGCLASLPGMVMGDAWASAVIFVGAPEPRVPQLAGFIVHESGR